MRRILARIVIATVGGLLVAAPAFLAYYHLVERGAFALATSPLTCLREDRVLTIPEARSCVTFETLAQTVPTFAAGVLALAAWWSPSRERLSRVVWVVGASWVPFGAFHISTRGLGHFGAWSTTLEFAAAVGAAAALVWWSAAAAYEGAKRPSG